MDITQVENYICQMKHKYDMWDNGYKYNDTVTGIP